MKSVFVVMLCVPWALCQPPGQFYSGPGSASQGSCPLQVCPTNCMPWQYRKACSFNSSGYCADCTGLGTDKYFNVSGGLTDSCSQQPQKTCTAGYINLNKNSTYEGDCTACNAIEAGKYFTTPTSPRSGCDVAIRNPCAVGYKDDNYNNPYLPPSCTACTGIAEGYYWVSRTPGQCTAEIKPTCQTGYSLTGYTDPSTNGTCVECTPVLNKYFVPNPGPSATCSMADCSDSNCLIGEYKSTCGNSFAGICTKCTNANASQVYSSRGGLNNICQVQGCTKACGIGEYIVGCGVAGAVSSSLTCGKCNNAVANYTYYTTGMGGYLPNSCPTSSCPICPNGYFTLGCANLTAGTCSPCTNMV